jgi:aldose sugar dehydrogenase
MKFLVLFSLLTITLFGSANGALKTEVIFEGKSPVWGFDFVTTDQLIITERDGRMILFDQKSKKTTELKHDTKSIVRGQGGLLDVMVYNEFVYWTASEQVSNGYTTVLYRAKINSEQLVEQQRLFEALTGGTKTIHYGSRLVVDQNQNLFMTIGDRNVRDESQKLTSHTGTILRLTLDGKPAEGNPFLDTPGALAEIYSYGHRNPQGIAIHPQTKEVWSGEFGPRGGDEINHIQAGKNYGWPVVTYGKEYWGPRIGEGTSKEGMEDPLVQFTPSLSYSGIAFYEGEMFSDWQNSLLLACLRTTHLHRLVFNEKREMITSERYLENLKERMRMVRVHPDGSIYVSTDSGKIYRVTR